MFKLAANKFKLMHYIKKCITVRVNYFTIKLDIAHRFYSSIIYYSCKSFGLCLLHSNSFLPFPGKANQKKKIVFANFSSPNPSAEVARIYKTKSISSSLYHSFLFKKTPINRSGLKNHGSFFFLFPMFEGPKTKIGIRSDGYFLIFQICILSVIRKPK